MILGYFKRQIFNGCLPLSGDSHLYYGFPPCIEGSFTCMNAIMVHTADLLYLKLYSKQAEQLEAECLAKGHAVSGIEPGLIKSNANT